MELTSVGENPEFQMCSAELAFRFVDHWLMQGNVLKISSTVNEDSKFKSMGFLGVIQIPKSHLLVKT